MPDHPRITPLHPARLAAAAAAAILALAPGRVAAQSVGVHLGDSLRTQVEPGARLTVPLKVDLSGAGSTSFASLQGVISWPRARFTLDSVRADGGSGFSLTVNTTGADTDGVLRFSTYAAEPLTASGVLFRLHFTAAAASGGSRISLSPEVAGGETGQSILPRLRVRPLEACVARRVPWGDASGDGALNIIDAQQLARYGLGLSVTQPEAVRQRGDVTANGTIDIIDAQQVARWSVGLSAVPRLGKSVLVVPPVHAVRAPSTTAVLAGRPVLVSADPVDSLGGTLTGCYPLAWSSSTTAVASIDSTGLATTAGAGATDLVAVSEGRSATTRLTVRDIASPTEITAVVGGTFKTWVLTRQGYYTGLLLNVMADHYSASWNNWNLRYYSSYGNECTQRCGWVNSTSSFYDQPPYFWYPYYAVLADANDVLALIRQDGVTVTDAATTKMVEAVAAMMQGVALGGIALHFDRGFILDENTVRAHPLPLPLKGRREIRDAALTKLEAAHALASTNSFSTPGEWLGAEGRSYTNTQLARLIRTLQAELLAQYPRNAAENAEVNWAQVATYASAGLSSAGGTEFEFYQQSNYADLVDGVKDWGNDIGTVRVDTRLAAIITDGPDSAKIHQTPWPTAGNPAPAASDRRVGDGSWGAGNVDYGFAPATANAGTDFVWSSRVIFNSSRGTYHQSNLAHIRYELLSGEPLTPGATGDGQAVVYTQAYNDLLWAEGLLRGGGSKATAAQLINKTRVTRGGLTALTGAESDANLLRALQYEQSIELLGLGGVPFYNTRRVTPAGHVALNNTGCPALLCLWPQTPRHLPIPAKELELLSMELYSFGGPSGPEAVAAASAGSASRVRGVREIAADLLARARAAARERAR